MLAAVPKGRNMRLLILAAALVAVVATPSLSESGHFLGLTVQSGETWIFRIDQGEPVDARKIDGSATPGSGELMVTLKPQMGAMMIVTNNTNKFYNYHAFLTMQPGSEGKATSVCTVANGGRMAIENWPYAVPAIRIADFRETDGNHISCE
jgi:hypothetical protein